MPLESRPVRVLLAASEVVGFAKTGGLADVAGALPRALADRGVDVAVILPLYRSARDGKARVEPTEHGFQVAIGARSVAGRFWRSTLPDSNVPVWLVEQSEYFERDDAASGRGIYQFVEPTGRKIDYPDNGERFIFFSKAVLAAMYVLDWRPDVIHCNDWQTGVVPALIKEGQPKRPDMHLPRMLFTVHNIAYQGLFPFEAFRLTGLPDRLFNWQQLEWHGKMNMLKAGLIFSDWITTVSPTYAREIQTPYYGNGMEGVITERRHELSGIVNGVDYRFWDPAVDPHIAERYTPQTVNAGKPTCKAALQRQLGLSESPSTPLLGMIARLVEQKGVELVVKATDAIMSHDVQLVILGEGDPKWHEALAQLQMKHPERFRAVLAFDEVLAHRIEAGADIFLMPSVYEPSGLNQLYSLKYGTVPVVRATGGLADTIVDTTEATLANGTATGFSFGAIAPWALHDTVRRALQLYRNQPETWRQIQLQGMAADWSWSRSALEYEKLYRMLAGLRHE